MQLKSADECLGVDWFGNLVSRDVTNWNVITALVFVDDRFLRFLFFGAINTVVGLSIYLAMIEVSGSVIIAVVAANLIGPVFNFFSTGRFVFRNKRLITFFPFVAGYILLCVLNMALVGILLKFGVGPRLAQILCLPILVMTSYLINDRLVFGRSA